MSRQTTEARADVRQAERVWNEHVTICATCTAAKQARRLRTGMCRPDGAAAYRALCAARDTLEANRELDRQPAPGQAVLW